MNPTASQIMMRKWIRKNYHKVCVDLGGLSCSLKPLSAMSLYDECGPVIPIYVKINKLTVWG